MPEEKKKESFTFSDKIKNSKGAASKSFANRISSKIGNDGKPHQTLFERTKRDAPFLVAGLAALLMLPFLYKYSGQATEEPNMVTPAGDAMFDPTLRDAPDFDMITGDPSDQIAQLSGRDSMDLIRWGGSKAEEEEDDEQPLPMRSAPDRSSSADKTTARRAASSNRSEETNVRNIFKPRPVAPMARTAINRLNSSGLNNRGGGKLGVGMWGGNLKGAAQKVRGPKPVNSVKPVSLQPLQAAGKPSRSYFGNPNAAKARQSLDAMSKYNAAEAIRDAQMNPVETGNIGGMTFGNGGMPGGNGGLGFNPNHQAAIKPWWWDEMQTRAHMDWERKFNYKWGWIDFATGLAQKLLDGVLSCVLTGTDDWSMGKMFGARKGSGKKPKCCGVEQKDWNAAWGEFSEANCKHREKQAKTDTTIKCDSGWEDGNVSDRNLGFFGVRFDCLSNGLGAIFDGDRGSFSGTEADCQHFAVYGNYTPTFISSKGKDWDIYHYVVGIEAGTIQKRVNAKNGNGSKQKLSLAEALEEYYNNTTPEDQQSALTILYVGKGKTFNSNIEQVQNMKGLPLFVEFAAFKKTVESEKKVRKKGVAASAENNKKNETRKYDPKFDPETEGVGTSYGEFKNKLRKGAYLVYDTHTETGEEVTKWERVKKGRMKKNRAIGGRCQFPLARISCEYYAVAGQSETESTTVRRGEVTETIEDGLRVRRRVDQTETTHRVKVEEGLPYAHVKFWKGAVETDKEAEDLYDILKKRFMLSYVVQGKDNKDNGVISTSADISTSQWYKAPHEDVYPFEGSWREEDDELHSASLGHEKEGNGQRGFQVLAMADTIADLRNSSPNEKNRVIITWEVRQCPDLEVDGSSISAGGCHDGLIDGGGADRPGVIVSSASCVYFDGSDVWGSSSVVTKEEEIVERESDKLLLSQTFRKIQEKYTERGGFSYENQHFNECETRTDLRLSGGHIGHYDRAVEDQIKPSALQYVNGVLRKINQDPKLQENNGGVTKEFEEYTDITIAEFTDAMTLDYTLNSAAEIDMKLVCEIGKSIGTLALDPTYSHVNNQFGAYVAYTGYDSSFFPAATNSGGAEDVRFVGCKNEKEVNCKQRFHYGLYNWNGKTLGDKQIYGPKGRNGYETYLDEHGWSTAKGQFPLQAIADAVINEKVGSGSFPFQNKTLAKGALPTNNTQQYNGTLDDMNRDVYHTWMKEKHVFFYGDATPCNVTGKMPVKDALDYLGLVCTNGHTAKPEHGFPKKTCGDAYGVSTTPGAN